MDKIFPEAGCICGHAFTWHRDVSRGVGDLVNCIGRMTGAPAQGCPCRKFTVYELHSERSEFAKAALTAMGPNIVRVMVLKDGKAINTINDDEFYGRTAKVAFDIADSMVNEAKKRDAV